MIVAPEHPWAASPRGATIPFDFSFRPAILLMQRCRLPRLPLSIGDPRRESAGRASPSLPGSKGCPLDPQETLLGGSGGKACPPQAVQSALMPQAAARRRVPQSPSTSLSDLLSCSCNAAAFRDCPLALATFAERVQGGHRPPCRGPRGVPLIPKRLCWAGRVGKPARRRQCRARSCRRRPHAGACHNPLRLLFPTCYPAHATLPPSATAP